MLGITIWATKKGGYGPLISQGSSYTTFSRPWAWFYSITSTLGAISAGLINQADFTRFTKKQGRQIPGLALCLYLPGVAVPLMGLLTASATVNIWGVAYWNPVEILLQWMIDDYSSKARAAAFFCGFGFVCSQLALNTVGNGFAAGMDMAGLFPKYINIRRVSFDFPMNEYKAEPLLTAELGILDMCRTFMGLSSMAILQHVIGLYCRHGFVLGLSGTTHWHHDHRLLLTSQAGEFQQIILVRELS